MNYLPAILIGGPPHSGKSVLLYIPTIALHKRNITHHAIRACPDGAGTGNNSQNRNRRETPGLFADWPVTRIVC